ncbi:16242_t:CDS:1, partial [Dentiscutata heterogama]
AMNIQTVRATGKSPYSLVFGQDPLKNFSILEDLYQKNVVDEENLPDDFFEESDDNDLLLDQSESLDQSKLPTVLNREFSTLNQFESSTLNQVKSLTLNQFESSTPNQFESSTPNDN